MKFKNNFVMKSFAARIKGMITYLLGNFPNPAVQANKDKVSLTLKETPDAMNGYANGTHIHAESDIEFLTGLVFHELGHLLYTWFPGLTKIKNSAENQKLDPDFERFIDSHLVDKVNKDFEDDKAFAYYLVHSLRDFLNIVEDAYLERALIRYYQNVLTSGLKRLREQHWDIYTQTIQQVNDARESKQIGEVTAYFALALNYGLYGKLKRDSDSELKLPILDKFREDLDDFIKVISISNKVNRFYQTVAYYFEHLYDDVKNEYQEKQDHPQMEGSGDGKPTKGESESSGGGKSSGSATGLRSRMSESVDSSLFDGIEDPSGEQEAVTEGDGDKDKNTVKNESLENVKDISGPENPNYEFQDKDNEALEAMIQQAVKLAELDEQAYMEEQALINAESEKEQSILNEITELDIHHGFKAKVVDMREKDDLQNEYNAIFDTVKDYVDEVTEEVNKVINQMSKNLTKRGLWYGGKLNTRLAHRPDVGYYERDVIYSPKADLALYLLIDESGSMSGERINSAIRASVLLDEVARKLNVPTAIYGHTESWGNEVMMMKYKDFDDTEETKYNIVRMDARASNRDGFALRYGLEILEQRKEQKKLLIIISDGQPAATNYHGREAYQDMQDAVEQYKSSIDVVAFGIGDDRDTLEKIYGSKRFVSCSSLSALGENLVDVLTNSLFS